MGAEARRGALTAEALHAVLADQRVMHPELRRPLTWNGLLAILRRLRIRVVRAPGKRPAALLHQCGVTVLMINSNLPARRHTFYAAHELAHFWLHADTESELCYHMDDDCSDDARERDADDLATLILGGPKLHREF